MGDNASKISEEDVEYLETNTQFSQNVIVEYYKAFIVSNRNKRTRNRSGSVLWQKSLSNSKAIPQNDARNFYHTAIATRLKTVSFNSDSNPTGVIKPVNGIPTFPPTSKAVEWKWHTYKHL